MKLVIKENRDRTKFQNGADENDAPTSERNLEGVDPELLISISRQPSFANYSGLRSKLANCDETWMQEFLDRGGVTLLFDALVVLNDRSMAKLTDAILVLECVLCLKRILQSNAGMNYMITNPAVSKNLVLGKLILTLLIWLVVIGSLTLTHDFIFLRGYTGLTPKSFLLRSDFCCIPM